eukprot:scaffold241_cov242-Pinguiococcus_pyrenoidosus.AAC.18
MATHLRLPPKQHSVLAWNRFHTGVSEKTNQIICVIVQAFKRRQDGRGDCCRCGSEVCSSIMGSR